MTIAATSLDALLTGAFGGTGVLVGGALALGIRHGIDWDHIAAITDITSSTSGGVARKGAHASNQHFTTQALVVDRDVSGGPLRRYFAEQRRPFLLGCL